MKWGHRKNTLAALQEKHRAKPKKPDVNGVQYHSTNFKKSSTVLGSSQIKNLGRQMIKGEVTSFVEKENGELTMSKTSKGVAIRDKYGNRITDSDYERAQRYVTNLTGSRANTGTWN